MRFLRWLFGWSPPLPEDFRDRDIHFLVPRLGLGTHCLPGSAGWTLVVLLPFGYSPKANSEPAEPARHGIPRPSLGTRIWEITNLISRTLLRRCRSEVLEQPASVRDWTICFLDHVVSYVESDNYGKFT
jgi:hypothetical protein